MRVKVLLAALALATLALVVQRASGDDPGAIVGVTHELAGRWTTKSKAYADRFVEIRATEIVFGQGEEGQITHPIVDVRLSPSPDGRSLYVVRFRVAEEEGAVARLELSVGRSDLIIVNQPGVRWTAAR